MNKNESPVFTKWWYWVSFIILAILSLPTDIGIIIVGIVFMIWMILDFKKKLPNGKTKEQIWKENHKNHQSLKNDDKQPTQKELIKNQLKKDNARKFKNVYFDFKTKNLFRNHLLGEFDKEYFENLISYKVNTQGKSKEKHHRITRAVVGTVLLGGVGGAVGAVTGGKKYDVITNLSVNINFRGGKTWIVKFINSETKTDSYFYKQMLQECDKLVATLQEIEKFYQSKENKDSIKDDDYTNTINTSNLYSNKNHNFKDNNYYPSTPYYPEIDDDLNIENINDDVDWEKEEKEAEELDRYFSIQEHWKKKKENPIHHLRRALYDYVILDIETNGLKPWEDDIIQVSAIKFVNDEETERYDTYVKPIKHDISDKITKLTSITNHRVQDAPTISTVIKELEEFVGDFPIIGHNIDKFDIPFLIEKGFSPQKISTEDTLKMARNSNLDTKDNKLPTLKEYFGIENVSHNSLNDCITTSIVYKKLRDLNLNNK
ncbi:PolC-type DNA polymerase III [Fructilactobacillus sanfranciscensis]|uniref:3'-5' exonuclease n=1 Tax=Fructilactobacillus sanfranciscensis TaxID=1625 RepID=UPI000CD43F68|nr:3'-5' exonuclease [Fructilactobacillus sanfranciscensis]